MPGFGGSAIAGIGADISAGLLGLREQKRREAQENLRQQQLMQAIQLARSAEQRAQESHGLNIERGQLGLEGDRTLAEQRDLLLGAYEDPVAAASVLTGLESPQSYGLGMRGTEADVTTKEATARYADPMAAANLDYTRAAAQRARRPPSSGGGGGFGDPGTTTDTRIGAIDRRATSYVTSLAMQDEARLMQLRQKLNAVAAQGVPLDTESAAILNAVNSYFMLRNGKILEMSEAGGVDRTQGLNEAKRFAISELLKAQETGEPEGGGLRGDLLIGMQ